MTKILVFDAFVFQHEVDFFSSLGSLKLLPIKHFLFQLDDALNGQIIGLHF